MLDVICVTTRTLPDHLVFYHHFDGAIVGGSSDKRCEEMHATRHNAAWTNFHESSGHTHPVAWDDGPLLILLQSAACKALPSDVISAHDAVAEEVLDALRTAGYLMVRA